MYKIFIFYYFCVKLIWNIAFLFSFFYFFYLTLTINVKKLWLKISSKSDFDYSNSNLLELCLFIMINCRGKNFFITFVLFLIIFKLMAPFLFLVLFINFFINFFLPLLCCKNIIIEASQSSIELRFMLINYCSLKNILKLNIRILKNYPNIVIFNRIYEFFLKKKNPWKTLNFLFNVLKVIFISMTLQLTFKYVLYALKSSFLLIFMYNTTTRNKNINIKIKALIKLFIKSPLLTVLETTIIPLEFKNYKRRIIKNNWKITLNPKLPQEYFLNWNAAHRDLLKFQFNYFFVIYSDRLINQRTNFKHQAVIHPDGRIVKFSSSPIVDNEVLKKFNYLQDLNYTQYYRIQHVKNQTNWNQKNSALYLGIIPSFYKKHNLMDKDYNLIFHIRLSVNLLINQYTNNYSEENKIKLKELLKISEQTDIELSQNLKNKRIPALNEIKESVLFNKNFEFDKNFYKNDPWN